MDGRYYEKSGSKEIKDKWEKSFSNRSFGKGEVILEMDDSHGVTDPSKSTKEQHAYVERIFRLVLLVHKRILISGEYEWTLT